MHYDRHEADANSALGQVAIPHEPELAAVRTRLDATLAHTLSIEGMISGAVDRLAGARPSGLQGGAADQPARCGVVGDMNDLLDRIVATLDRINGECAHLNRFV